MKKKLLSILLCFGIVFQLIPTTAIAMEVESNTIETDNIDIIDSEVKESESNLDDTIFESKEENIEQASLYETDELQILGTNIIKSGTCGALDNGENIKWELTVGGHLTISGSGETANYSYPNYTPWYSERNIITSVTVSDDITKLGDNLLNGLNITTAEIPNSVLELGNAVFSGCKNLIKITVSSGNSAFVSDNGILFNHNKTALIAYPAGITNSEYVVPNSVTNIYSNAFAWNTNLQTVSLPNNGNYTFINGNMFYGCSRLKSISIPEGVTGMGINVFTSCSSLENVFIPSTMVTFNSTFANLGSLQTILFAKASKLTALPDSFATNCTSLRSIELPTNIEQIGDKAFMGSGLQTLTFESDGVSNLTSIGVNAFNNNYGQSDNTSLMTLEWDALANLQNIGANAFKKCKGMTEIPFDKLTKLSQIGDSAFNGCSGVPSVLRLNQLSNLGNNCFDQQPSIISVDLTRVADTISFGSQMWHNSVNNPIFYLANTSVLETIKLSIQRAAHINAVTNGGRFATDAVFTAGTLAIPIKEGYAFAGWYDNADFKGDPVINALTNKTYYAKWEIKYYTVKYDTKGAGEILDKEAIRFSDKDLIPVAPSKENHIFLGWKYQDMDVTNATTYDSLVTDDTVMSITLVAQWKENNYKVKYNTGFEDIIVVDKENVKWNDANLLPEPPKKDGYGFIGWEINDIEVLATDKYSELTTNQIDGSFITLTGKWVELTDYSVLYNANGGSMPKYTPSTITGIKYADTVPTPIPIREGYTFKGWTYQDAGVKDGSNYQSLAENDTIKQIELVAQWEINKYTIDYEFVSDKSLDGVNLPKDITVEYGSTTDEPKFTATDNWIFDGWYTDKECTQKFDFNTAITRDVTLYGKWIYIEPEKPKPEEPTKPIAPETKLPDAPKTGDTSNVMLYFGLIALFGCVAGYGFKKKKLK